MLEKHLPLSVFSKVYFIPFSGDRVRSVIVTTLSLTQEYDFVSRYFAPWVGIPEDPGNCRCKKIHFLQGNLFIFLSISSVTGSAHTVLAPFWASRLNKTVLRARQCSQRGGELGKDGKQLTLTVQFDTNSKHNLHAFQISITICYIVQKIAQCVWTMNV